MYDRHVVRQIVEVTPKTVLVNHHRDSDRAPERRKLAAVVAIFKVREEALSSIPILEMLTRNLYQAEKKAKADYHAAAKALANG